MKQVREMTKHEIFKNQAALSSLMANFINTVYPKLRARLDQGYQLKNDGTLYQKDKDIKELVRNEFEQFKGDYGEQGCDIHWVSLSASHSTLKLEVKGRYKTGPFSCSYVDDSVYLDDLHNCKAFDFEERKPVTTEELEEASKELARLREVEHEIVSNINKLRRLLNA